MFARDAVDSKFIGVEVTGQLASYALGVVGEDVRTGRDLTTHVDWSQIAAELPQPSTENAGTTVAVDFSLDPGSAQTIRFLLAWCASTWNANGYNWAEDGNVFRHMYAKQYPTARGTAEMLA